MTLKQFSTLQEGDKFTYRGQEYEVTLVETFAPHCFFPVHAVVAEAYPTEEFGAVLTLHISYLYHNNLKHLKKVNK